MKKLNSSLISLCTLAILSSACLKLEGGSSKKHTSNQIIATTEVDQTYGEGDKERRVISADMLAQSGILPVDSSLAQKLLQQLPKSSQVMQVVSPEVEVLAEEPSLLVGIPFGLIGHQSIFGGVITKITDSTNETLGTLKLTDLPPIHVRTVMTQDQQGAPVLAMVGCANDCDERSKQAALLSFSVVGVDQENKKLMLDLAPIGQELDLISLLDPKGEYTKIKAISSATTMVDYSDISTLVFDIKTKFIPVTAQPTDADVKITEITVRWYLKLTSAFSSAFTARSPVEGVGFFETTRSKSPKITRFDTTEKYSNIVYHIKNVPTEFRPHFKKAIENWNGIFKEKTGKEMLEAVFVEKTDPLYSELVTGDVRYNIIEWDLDNKATYGGLGPSIANQFTGEVLSANILIQGPTIMDLYTKWFKLSQEVRDLKLQGQTKLANDLMRDFNLKAARTLARRAQTKYSVKLGQFLEMTVRSQQGDLEDPVNKGDFEIVPEGVTFEKYMEGYFVEMVEHELGHNLGLRHNFKGNLGAADQAGEGFVSRSIMEYLGRPFRHLNIIGLYDRMAINYGYAGVVPTHKDWFCSDEDQATDAATVLTKSPECSKADATSDPFSYWEKRLSRALDMLLARHNTEAPSWKVSELSTQLNDMLIAFANYGVSAEKTAATWTNFFGKGDRPERKEDVRAYVLGKVKKQLCSLKIPEVIAAKASEEAKAAATTNMNELKKLFVDKNKELAAFTEEELKCI